MNGGDMEKAFAAAFSEWQRIRQSENSRLFSEEESQRMAPDEYGRLCSVVFIEILNKLADGKPWDQIGE